MKKFIPKLTDKSIEDINVSEFFVEAGVVMRNYNLFNNLSTQINKYTIDPCTNRFPYNSIKSLEKLPYYFNKSKFQNMLDDSSVRLKELIIPCVDFQIEKGSQHIIPPYFYAEDVTSQTFNVNIENITTVLKYLDKMGGQFCVYPAINISKNLLTNDNLLRYVVSSYTSDEFSSSIKGFYLVIDGLNTSQASEDELIGFLQLVKALSKWDVRIVSINAFGYAGLLLGASTFISGLTSSESNSVEVWKLSKEERENIRSRDPSFIYMPSIFTYIQDVELKSMGFVCDCSQCNNSLPNKSIEKKRHFLRCREKDIESVFKGDFNFDQSTKLLKEMYFQGKKTAIKMLSDKHTKRKYADILSPISRWLNVLDKAEEIEKQEEAENQLNLILKEIDEHNKNNN